MEEEAEHGVEVYTHHGVLVKSYAPCDKNVDLQYNVGTLSVVEYPASGLGRCVEWRQCDVSIEGVDQEWAIVQDTQGRSRTLSGAASNWRPPVIQMQLKRILSFRVMKNNSLLTLVECGGLSHSTFQFQHANADCFVNFLKGALKTSSCSKDPNLYLIMDQPDVQNLEKSFAELDLFTDNTRTDAVWGFLRKFHHDPYETTMSAFCKVTDALLYKPQQHDHEVAEWLNRSLTAEEVGDLNGRVSGEEYEVISRAPPLPPRTTPPRCPPLSPDQWANFFDPEGRVLEPDIVREIVFHGGVTPSIRTDVWKYLLDYYPWNSTQAEREALFKEKEREYYVMKLQWKTISQGQEDRFAGFKERKSLIDKDVYRTDRNLEFYSGDRNANLERLQHILMTYMVYNFDLGYVQGMSDLLAPLLMQIQGEVDTFWCFVGFMELVCRNFDEDQAGMKQQLQHLYTLLATAEPELTQYLDQHESGNMSFCFRWLLVWFKREFTYSDIHQLWEVLWSRSLCPNFHLLICVAILSTEKEALMSNNFEFTEILKHVNELSNKMDLKLLLRKAEGVFLQLSTASKVPPLVREVLGLEPLPEAPEEAQEVRPEAASTDRSPTALDTITFAVDTQELAFERSLTLQFI